VPWIVAGVGIAAAATGVVMGLEARSHHDSATNAEFANDAARLNKQARTFALAANVLFVSGGALVVGGASWGIIDRAGGSSDRGAEGAMLVVNGRF